MTDWPHQTHGVEEAARHIARGVPRVCVTAPTGTGKTRMMLRMIGWGQQTCVYTNRRMLLEQLSRNMDSGGVAHDIAASGYAEGISEQVTVASIQTVAKRWGECRMHLPPAELVLIDELHNEKGDRMQELIAAHVETGASVVGFTATPVGIGHLVDELVVAAVTSEGRDCGALVPAVTVAPDEPSMKAFRSKHAAILQFRDEVREVMLHAVVGRVLDNYHTLNPDRLPAVLFAPGVAESVWFAQRFTAHGIPAAHIDGERIWVNGDFQEANQENREKLREASESGRVKVVCNRFVLREGIDWPHLHHGILACTFGGICGYLQACGRLLRNHPSMDRVILQDHGGNWWRHDSVNCDRVWTLDDTEGRIRRAREENFRTKSEPEPIACGKCGAVRKRGPSCWRCGHTTKVSCRKVIEEDGTLREVRGDVFKPRRVSNAPEHHKLWTSCVFRCKHTGRTFAQARGLFMRESRGMVPGEDFPFMPKSEDDWYRKVADVVTSKKRTA